MKSALLIITIACLGIAGVQAQNIYPSPYTITTFAGQIGVPGGHSGKGTAAQFSGPEGVAVDSSGNIYVADTQNSAIRKITPAGMVTNFAGFPGRRGGTDGVGSAVRFLQPVGIAVDTADNVYVTDVGNGIRKITPAGVVSTIAKNPWKMRGIAVDTAGNVYFTTFGGNPPNLTFSIDKIDPSLTASNFITYASFETDTDELAFPGALTIDANGNLYATAGYAVFEITPLGTVTTMAGIIDAGGTSDGTGNAARFAGLEGLAVDDEGNVIVAEYDDIREISPEGVVITLAGVPGVFNSTDGTGEEARFNSPEGVTVNASGTLYIADTGNETIRAGTLAFIINSPVSVTSVIRNPLSFQPTADAPVASWSFTGTLPTGLSFSSATGLLSGKPTQSGTFPIIITATGPLGTCSAPLTITIVTSRLAQTITFASPLPDQTEYVPPIRLGTTASSGLPITYRIIGPATLSGNILTVTGAGAIIVSARQVGNALYLPAELNKQFTVKKAK